MTAKKKPNYEARLLKKFNRCPFCNSTDLSTKDKEGEKILTLVEECGHCGGTWCEHYQFMSASDFEPGEVT